MKVTYEHDGETFDLQCSDSWVSRWISEKILLGESYLPIKFVEGINVVMDIGANCGASTVFFAKLYPQATILAFEPAREPYSLLEANTEHLPNVRCFNLGFHDADQTARLYHGVDDSMISSIYESVETRDDYEMVTLRSVRRWLDENSVNQIDLLKVDTEGCEVPIFRELRDRLPSVKIVYFEYHSAEDRQELDRLLSDTHVLTAGRMWVSWGEAAYVAKDAFPESGLAGAAVRDWVAEAFNCWSRP